MDGVDDRAATRRSTTTPLKTTPRVSTSVDAARWTDDGTERRQ
jgi:hypothetical protein